MPGNVNSGTEQQFRIQNKQREKTDIMIQYLGDLLQPQTEGFDHVNMDLTFTYLGNWDLMYVDDKSLKITMCNIFKLPQSEYLLRGQLASFLNSRKSRGAKSMDLINSVITKTQQQFEDRTKPKQGFTMFGFGKKGQ